MPERTHLPPARAIWIAALLGCNACEVGDADLGGEQYLGADAGAPADDAVPLAVACGTRLLLVNYDAAAQLFGGQFQIQEARDSGVTVVVDGNKRVQSNLRASDPQVYGGPRAETAVIGSAASRYQSGDVRYYGFRVYIPAGWIDDSGNEDILFQWKNIADPGEADKSPDAFLAVKRHELVLRVTWDSRAISTSTSPIKLQYTLATGLDFSRGTWHDLVFRFQWSHTAGVGRTTAWYKRSDQSSYTRVLDVVGPNKFNDQTKSYLKWGIYKPAWRNGPTATSERTVRHDNIRAGTTFDGVRPDGALCP
jgi:hypothetical protein